MVSNNSLLETNLNAAPYVDDFDPTKQYYQVLFKPSTAVQVRELNVLQSMLQNQISQFGQNIFKEGSVIEGCIFTFDNNYDYVKLNDTYANGSAINVSSLIGYTITNPNGLIATVIDAIQGLYSNNPDLNTLYIKYLNSTTFANGSTQSAFNPSELLTITSSANIVQGSVLSANVANVSGTGYAFTTTEGVVFKKGYFIYVSPQTVVIDKYNNIPDQISVGFEAKENIITASNDQSLFDNSTGSPNAGAPGADRLQIIPSLVIRPTNQSNTSSFFSLVDFVAGQPITIRNNTQFNSIEIEMALRSYETNGNFVVNPFIVTSSPIANTSDPNYSNNFNAIVSSGTGYVNGYRVQYLNNNTKMIRRGTDFANISAQQVSLNFGYYALVDELSGVFGDSHDITEVQLHNVTKTSVTSKTFLSTTYSSTTQIGTAYIRGFSFNNGSQGSNTAEYNVYLFDISMNPGSNFSNVKSLLYVDSGNLEGVADVVLTYNATSNTNIASLNDSSINAMIFPFGQRAIKPNGFNNVEFTYRSLSNTQFLTTGLATVAVNTPVGMGSETFIYSGTLSSTEMNDFIVVSTQTGYSNNKSGNVQVYSTNTSVVGTSSTFTTDYYVGDIIYTSSQYKTITSISNNTYLNVDSAFSANASNLSHQKAFVNGNPIPFAGRSNRSMTISANSLSINIGETISSAFNIQVDHSLVRSSTTSIKKDLNPSVFVKLNLANNGATNIGPWCLGIPDAYRLTGVYIDTSGGGTYSNSGTNYVSNFFLDNGQRDMHYDLSYLNVITNSSADRLTPNTTILVQLSAFTFDTSEGVGFFNAYSYPIDDINLSNTYAITTAEISTYTTSSGTFVDLRDCVDFRPYASNTATISTTISGATVNPSSTLAFNYVPYLPAPDSIFQSDIEYYMGRTDRLAIDTNGNLIDTEGNPSVISNPIAPNELSGTMTLSLITIPPYPSLTTSEAKHYGRYDYAISSQSSQNRRYTMKDIGSLDRRITNLEYYTSLSILEQSVSSLQTQTETTGQTRFQNGIFVDPFQGFDLSNTLDPNFWCAIDPARNELRPAFSQMSNSLKFNETASSGVGLYGELIMLNNTANNLFIQQGYASQYRNCIDGNIYIWAGTIKLTPSGSLTPDLSVSPDVINNICLAQNWINLADAWGTQWGNWETTSTSTSCTPVGSSTTSQQVCGGTLNTTTTSTLQTTSSVQQQLGKQLTNSVSNQTLNLGTFVTNVSILPFIPSATIQFAATGMKPNTRLYAYFGNVPVSAWCSPNVNSNLGTPLYSDSSGNCNGYFVIPANTFQSQQITFELNDISDLIQGANAITTQADGVYYGSTLAVSSGSSLLNTRNTVISSTEVSQQQTITQSTVTQNITQQYIANPPPSPPAPYPCINYCGNIGTSGGWAYAQDSESGAIGNDGTFIGDPNAISFMGSCGIGVGASSEIAGGQF